MNKILDSEIIKNTNINVEENRVDQTEIVS